MKKLWPPESCYPNSGFMLEVCSHIDSFFNIFEEKIKKKIKSSCDKQENQDRQKEIKQETELEPKNEEIFLPEQIMQDPLQTSRLLQLRLSGFYDLKIEDEIYMLEHDKVPLARTNNFSEKSTSDLDTQA